MVNGGTKYGHVLKYMGLLGGVQGLTILISVIRNKCAALFIGVAGIGMVDLYYRTIELLGNATNLGIPFSAIKKISELYEQGDQSQLREAVMTVRTWAFGVGLLGTLVCCLCSPLIALWTLGDVEQYSAICLLSPMILFMLLYGSETAIMKGLRRLKDIALVSVLGALVTLLVSIPLYYYARLDGVIPVLLLSSCSLACIQLFFSTRIYRWRIRLLDKTVLIRGKAMVLLGVTYVMAGIAGSGAEVAIRSYIKQVDSIEQVGLYSAAFVLCVTYSRLIFVAMDADYFPCLSAVGNDLKRMNETINRQISVCVLLSAPGLCFFMILMPSIVCLLYTPSFLAMLPMAMAASFYLFLKAVTLPIAYLSLAKGDAFVYFCMELIYDVFFMACVIVGYTYWGLLGAGLALALANFFDLILIYVVYHVRYQFQFAGQTLKQVCCQVVLVLAVWLILTYERAVWQYVLSGLVTAFSIGISYYYLNREIHFATHLTHFLARFKKKKDD